MLLAFIDESYNRDLFCLSALVADDRMTIDLSGRLDQVVESIRSSGFPDVQELHGHEIFHGAGEWRGVPLRLRMHVYVQAAQAIGESGALAVFSDLARHDDKSGDATPAHERALRQLLERLEALAEERSQYMLVLADEVHSAERHRTNFRFYQDADHDGGHAGRLARILDTLYFGPSRHSRMLQAADLLTFIRLRRSTVTEPQPNATRVNDTIWAYVEPIVEAGRADHTSTKAPI